MWQERFFYPNAPSERMGSELTIETIPLGQKVGEWPLIGDLTGNGRMEMVVSSADTYEILVIDLQTYESFSIELEPYSIPEIFHKRPIQLVEYDNEPGLEILAQVKTDPHPGSYQIVSPRQRKVIHHFLGGVGDDIDGDGKWFGYTHAYDLFQSSTGDWKLTGQISTPPPDFGPRGIQIMDVASGEREMIFRVSGGVVAYSSFQTAENRWIVFAPLAPSNGYEEPLDGIPTNDNENDVIALSMDEKAEPQNRLKLEWHDKRNELASGRSMITTDASGRPVVIVTDEMIRVFDPISTGFLHVSELLTGNVINRISAGDELSFKWTMSVEGSNIIYASLLEENRILKYDIHQGTKLAEADFSDDFIATYVGLAVVDMNGDDKQEVLFARNASSDSSLLVLDEDLKTLDSLPLPSNVRFYVIDFARIRTSTYQTIISRLHSLLFYIFISGK